MNKVLTSTISVVVVDRGDRPIDWKLLEVGASVTVELCIEVREDTALQQRIIREINAANNVTWLELFSVSLVQLEVITSSRTMICSVSAK